MRSRPPMDLKLLKKPPFRFLRDAVAEVLKVTGFLDGLFTEGFPHLHVCYDAWQALVARHLPRLSKHITRQPLPERRA